MDLMLLFSMGVLVIITVVLVVYFGSMFNKFYSLKNSAEATLGQIRVAMKKRLDMIEQLRVCQNLCEI